MSVVGGCHLSQGHDDVIKWKHFPRYWPVVRGIHRSPVNSPHIGQWRGALMFPLICVGINRWINKREAGDLRRNCAHYDVSVMNYCYLICSRYNICAVYQNHLIKKCKYNGDITGPPWRLKQPALRNFGQQLFVLTTNKHNTKQHITGLLW